MSGLPKDGSVPIDFFPWSDDEEAAYEQFAYEQDLKRYNETMAAIDADGGDISHLLYQDPNDPVQLNDSEQTDYP